MNVRYAIDKEGGVAAIDLDSRTGIYGYPTSTLAETVKKGNEKKRLAYLSKHIERELTFPDPYNLRPAFFERMLNLL